MVSLKHKAAAIEGHSEAFEQSKKKKKSHSHEVPGTSGSAFKEAKEKNNFPFSRKKRVFIKPVEEEVVKDEPEEDDDDEEVDIEEENDNDSDVDVKHQIKIEKAQEMAEINWPEQDLMELITRMERIIPPKDTLKLQSRVHKLNWNDVCFGDHSADECKKVWLSIQQRLRRYRLLREVLEDAKDWVSKPWTDFYRGARGARHPQLPKTPLTSYLLYFMKKKDEVLKANPRLAITKVSKLVAKEFKNLPAKKKAKYVALAAAERRVYRKKMAQFYIDHPNQAPKTHVVKVESDDEKRVGPQKPPTSHSGTGTLRKHSGDDKAGRDLRKDLRDKRKSECIDGEKEEEDTHQEDLKVDRSDNPAVVASATKPVPTKDETSKTEKIVGKPEKPPNSGYSLFSRLMLANSNMKKHPPKERMGKIARLWKSMTDEDQAKYKEQVTHMLAQYKLEYAAYFESLSEEKKAEELSKNQPKGKVTKSAKPRADARPKAPKKKAGGAVKGANKLEEDSKAVGSQPDFLFKNEPVQPPVNVCSLFMETFTKNQTHIPIAQRERKAIKAWKDATDDEKAVLRKELTERKQQYLKSFETFLKSLSQEDLKEYSLWKAKEKAPEFSEDSDSESVSSRDSDSESGSSDSGNEDASSYGDNN